jgi:hypothetical protein
MYDIINSENSLSHYLLFVRKPAKYPFLGTVASMKTFPEPKQSRPKSFSLLPPTDSLKNVYKKIFNIIHIIVKHEI